MGQTPVKEKSIVMDILFGDKMANKINGFMHAADMFEAGKQFALFERVVVTGEPNIEKLPTNMRDAYEKAGGYLIFASVRTIDGNKPEKTITWFKEGVQSISNGEKWRTFKEVLAKLGYDAETDEHMHVTKIKDKSYTEFF